MGLRHDCLCVRGVLHTVCQHFRDIITHHVGALLLRCYRYEFYRSGIYRSAFCRSIFCRSAFCRSTFCRSALDRSALYRSALYRSTFCRSAFIHLRSIAPRASLLLIDGAASLREGSVFAQGVAELPVQPVCRGGGDSIPDEDNHDDARCFTLVTRPLSNQDQQLLLLASPPDHLGDHTQSHSHTHRH